MIPMLADRRWAVSPGERYRFRSPPGIRMTTTNLLPDEARRFAVNLHEAVKGGDDTYTG